MSNVNELISALDSLEYADKKIGDVWLMPQPDVCLMFAVTEYGEAVNDQINSMNAGFARNNVQRSPDVAKELADVAMMLLKYYAAAYGFDRAKKVLLDSVKKAETEKNSKSFLDTLRDLGVDVNVVNDIIKIGGIVTYAMMMMQSRGVNPAVDVIVASALLLIAGNELFASKPLSQYIKEKIDATIEKVQMRQMVIQ